MKKNSIIASFILLITTISSCELVIPLELPNQEPKLVANCIFNSDSLWHIEISKSVSSLGIERPSSFPDANLVLKEDGNPIQDLILDSTLVNIFGSNEEYQYFYRSLSSKPIEGKNYTLEVSKDGFESISASEKAIETIRIDTILVQDSVYEDSFNNYYAEVKIRFKDLPNVKNHYSFRFAQVYYDPFNNEYYIYSTGFYSKDLSLRENYQKELGDEEGTLGVYHYRVPFFTDAFFENRDKEIIIYVESWLFRNQTPDEQLFVELVTHSEASYLYSLQAERQQYNDGNPFAEPVQVYSNIENGLGIFGSYSNDFKEVEK